MPVSSEPPKILILYGSLRKQSYSRFLAEYAASLLESWGAEVRFYHPHKLPLFDRQNVDHPEVQKLLELTVWSEGMIWSCPEYQGSLSGVFKNQIDWIPLKEGAVRPTQGKTLALLQVTGGSQSYNVVNQMRVIGRWMRMLTIPNQSSVPKAWQEFDENGHMRESALKDRIVDVAEELLKFTLLTRQHRDFFLERYSEQKAIEQTGKLIKGEGV